MPSLLAAIVCASVMNAPANEQVQVPALNNELINSKLLEVAKTVAVEFRSENLKPDEIGISVYVPSLNLGGSYRGDVAMYPASVVKLFYIAYGAHLLDGKRLTMTPELERGFKDMIVESSNDATALVLDAVTGTTGGPELSEPELKGWMEKRRAVNRWLEGFGFKGINANQKTWNEGPYGRERQGYGPNFEYRNSLTPDSCVQLLSLISSEKLVSKERTDWILGYMKREIVADSKNADGQSKGFTGSILPSGYKLWSKAGWTSTVYHDLALVETPDGRKAIIAVFCKGHASNTKIIPFMAKETLKAIGIIRS